MAQIIKNRRGSLDRLSTATGSLQKGEILIATGSSKLTGVTNGGAIVFAAYESGSVVAANRVLTGATAPSFDSATYGTLMDGVPYYASSSNTLILLKADGNVTPDFTGNISTFSSSVATSFSASAASVATVTGTFSSSVATSFSASAASVTALSSSVSSSIGSLSSSVATSFSASAASQNALSGAIATSISASVAAGTPTFANITGKPAGLVSGSSQVVLNDADKTGFNTDDVSEGTTNKYFTDARAQSAVATVGYFTSAGSIDITQLSGFTTFSGNIDSAISASNFRITNLETTIDGGSF
jgi:hypothetical protein